MASASAPAVTLCVRPDGSGGCFATIQAAVDVATAGEEILIAAGTYTENVNVVTNLTLTGGWQPAGWTLTETVIHAAGGSCALVLNGVSGRVASLTVTGATYAGLCGLGLADFTVDHLTARQNEGDGAILFAAEMFTISHSIFRDNQEDGLNLECPYGGEWGRDLVVNESQAIGNGRNGFDGSDAYCNYYFDQVVAQDNLAAGFDGFVGACPAAPTHQSTGAAKVTISGSDIAGNQIGLRGHCGNSFRLSGNHIHQNQYGIVMNEGGMRSVNNLVTDNLDRAIVLRAAYWRGMNDTVAGNGGPAFTLTDDMTPIPQRSAPSSACDKPVVYLVNNIIWGDAPAITWDYLDFCVPIGVPFYVSITHSLVAGRDLLVDQADIIDFDIGPAVYDLDPFFVGAGDYHLRPPSLAIDGGTANDAPAVDIAGVARPMDGDGDGTPEFDLGAYESPPQIFWRVYLPQTNT